MIATEKKYAYYPPETETVADRTLKQRRARQLSPLFVGRCVAGLVVLVSVALLLLVSFTTVIEKSYELDRLKQELAELQNENKRLQFSIGRLESLERVETVAVGKLGMVKAEQVRLLAFSGGEAQDSAQGQDGGLSGAGLPAGRLAATFATLSNLLTSPASAEAGKRP